MTEDVTLAACPCGRDDSIDNAVQEAAVILASVKAASGGRAYRVECTCGWQGPTEREASDAVRKWNARTPDPRLAAAEAALEEARAACTLDACPPGLFRFGDTLGFKTEYRAMETVGPVEVSGDQIRWKVGRWPDAYIVESGEYFWGGTSRHADRAALTVQPLTTPVQRQPDDWQARALAAEAALIDRRAEVRGEALEEAAKACEAQADVFLSPEYAVGQPISSISERVACAACAREIRNLKPQEATRG